MMLGVNWGAETIASLVDISRRPLLNWPSFSGALVRASRIACRVTAEDVDEAVRRRVQHSHGFTAAMAPNEKASASRFGELFAVRLQKGSRLKK